MKRQSVLLLVIANSVFKIERDRYKIQIDKLRIQNPRIIFFGQNLSKKKIIEIFIYFEKYK